MDNEQVFKGLENSLAIIARVVADPELSAFADTLSQSWREEVIRAVAAERERCAKVVQDAKDMPDNDDDCPAFVFNRRLNCIADKIRSGE